MSWPKGRPRPRKVSSDAPLEAIECGGEAPPVLAVPRDPTQPPADWRKGALLNVRNRGDAYVVTLYPEEFDEERPDRALRFTNLGECQDFVSHWYAAEHHDPRAR